MDGVESSVSRVLVLGGDAEAREYVVNTLRKLCAQEPASEASQGVHNLSLKTKYYTADLEMHVHAVEANELFTPLKHDADHYEALVWVVDAASDASFLGTEQFVGNSIEELEFDVSLIVGTHATSASLVQLKRLENWACSNAFEFVAVEETQPASEEDPLHEKRGMERVKEALECNMWTALKPVDQSIAKATTNTSNQIQAVHAEKVDYQGEELEEETTAASKILVLGAELAEQHHVVKSLADLVGGETIDMEGETVQELKLKTKYYEADVELHLHRVDTNELVTALHYDVDEYEALLWVVDTSSDRSFKEVHQFVNRSIEELTFEVSLVIGTHVGEASAAQVANVETWCQDNGFEFVGLSVSAGKASDAHDEKEGIDRVLEALQCNMWRSMKSVTRQTESSPSFAPSTETLSTTEALTFSNVNGSCPPPTPVAPAVPESHEARLQASLDALSGAGFGEGDDPEMEAFSGLLSQVQRIRESGAVLSDEERRRQAERVAMQLWNLLGADSDDENDDSED